MDARRLAVATWVSAGRRAPGAGPLLVLGDTTRVQIRLEPDEIDASAVSDGAA